MVRKWTAWLEEAQGKVFNAGREQPIQSELEKWAFEDAREKGTCV